MHIFNSNNAKIVLVFNPLKRFIGAFTSLHNTAKAFGKDKVSIYEACAGRCISCNNLYFRYLPSNMSIEQVASMDLCTFDKINGLERKLYTSKQMTRKGMKYKKHQ